MGVYSTDGRGLYRADPLSYATDKAAFDINPASTGIKDYLIQEMDTMTFNANKAKYHYASSAIPKLFGSVTSDLKYKNFDLQFMFTYQLGGKVYDATYASLMDPGNYGSALHVDILNRWQKDGDVSNTPRMDGNATNRTYFSAQSDRWLIDASYINIRSLTLGYNIPASIMKKIDLSGCKIYASGENLYMFSKRKGMGVQQSFTGVTSNDYIPSRIVTLGVNFTF
jgi:hypothetical protein